MAEATTIVLQRLIDRLRAGDASARDDLFRHAGDRLHLLARKMLNSQFGRVRRYEESGDVVSAASVRLLRALEAVPVESAEQFYRLAATQIRRQLLDLVRHYYGPHGDGRHQQPLPVGDDGRPTEIAAESGGEAVRRVEWAELLERVESLPEDERAVVELLWVHDLTQPEAAEVLGVSLATVRRRWMAARLRLHELLDAAP